MGPWSLEIAIWTPNGGLSTGVFSYDGAGVGLIEALVGWGDGQFSYTGSGASLTDHWGAVTRTVTYGFTGGATGKASVTSSVIPQTIPFTIGLTTLPTPTGLTSTYVGSRQIDLSWSPVTEASSYQVERDGLLIASGVLTTDYSDTNLDPATVYTYRVRAVAE